MHTEHDIFGAKPVSSTVVRPAAAQQLHGPLGPSAAGVNTQELSAVSPASDSEGHDGSPTALHLRPSAATAAAKAADSGATPPDSGAYSYIAFHPYFRLLIAVSLTCCNFLIYGEDPIVHSHCEAELPVLGHAWGMVFLKYPGAGGVALAKVIIWLGCLVAGLLLGRLVFHHMLLRDLMGVGLFGWKHLDDDDIRASTLYKPTSRNTPYNMTWWWGTGAASEDPLQLPPEYRESSGDTTPVREEKERLREAFRLGASSAKKGGLTSQLVRTATSDVISVELRPSEPDWKDREEYQRTEETLMEVALPFYFHPRKHRDHSKGSLLVTMCIVCLVLTLGAVIYNNTILKAHYGGGDDFKALEVGPGLGMNEWRFGKAAAVLCWLADLLNLLVAADSILQELYRHHTAVRDAGISFEDASRVLIKQAYERPRIVALRQADLSLGPDAADAKRIAGLLVEPTPRFKMGYFRHFRLLAKVWMSRVNLPCFNWSVSFRVVFVWLIFLVCTSLVMAAVVGDLATWDEWQRVAGLEYSSTELFRIWLASMIAIQGPMTVAQDWEWPSFAGESDLAMPGVEFSELTCTSCCLSVSVTQQDREGNDLPSRKLPLTAFHITNKWLTFIPFFLSLCLDFSMLYASWEYAPGLYGQYTNPETHEICTTRNATYANEIKAAWEADKINIVNYTERLLDGYLEDGGTDFCIPARFVGSSSGLKLMAALPGFAAYVYTAYYFIKFIKIDRDLLAWEHAA